MTDQETLDQLQELAERWVKYDPRITAAELREAIHPRLFLLGGAVHNLRVENERLKQLVEYTKEFLWMHIPEHHRKEFDEALSNEDTEKRR